MDSFQGIPVEYKLDTFNMPRTGKTLCHPQNWLCRCDAQLSSRHLALNSPLGHFNGGNAHSHQIPDTRNSRWLQSSFPPTATWLLLNYGEHNPSHVRRYALPFSTLSYLHFVSPLTTRFAAQTQTTFSMLQLKTIPKNISTIGNLLLHPSFITLQTLRGNNTA